MFDARSIFEAYAATTDTSSHVESIQGPHYDPLSSNVFARCTESLVSWWLFWLVWWLARSWALVTDCGAYVFTPSMLAGSCSYILIDWASSQQPGPLCLTRSGWGGFAYSLDETSMKMRGRPSLILAWHWLPGQQGLDCSAKWLHSIWSLRHGMTCVITQNNTGYNKADCCISLLLDWTTTECWEFFNWGNWNLTLFWMRFQLPQRRCVHLKITVLNLSSGKDFFGNRTL